MINEYIYFSIGFEDVDWGNEEEQAKRYDFVNEFTTPFGIKCGFAGQGRVSLRMPNIDIFLDKLKQYSESRKMLFSKNCAYEQVYEGDSAWYKYLPLKSIETTEYIGRVISCKAANIPSNLHAGIGFDAHIFVSERFKKIVEENNLTGLEFLWCKDTGRYAPAQQWYMAIATQFVGRGLDAPWLDADSEKLSKSLKFPNGLGRIGVNKLFPAKCLLKDAQLPPRLEKYLSMCQLDKFTMSFPERFLRQYLPSTDFAFGYFSGWQGLYISKRAKDILMQSHIINENEIEPLIILDELPVGAMLLDSFESIPAFYFGSNGHIGETLTFEELKELHEDERKAYSKILKPQKKITIKQALSLVNSEKRNRPHDFEKRLNDKELEQWNIKLPSNWIELLRKSNGGYLSTECYVKPFRYIETLNAEKQKEGKGFYEEYPINRISVAEKGDGDWYDLVMDGDCSTDSQVVQVSHEGGDILREWADIATFISDMIVENE